ncbi:MAG: polysaccharide deacetylase family protein [Spirochaetes bacterium]|nr:polysaccharide deacetylase family protein [Spirochaetota bacterium]
MKKHIAVMLLGSMAVSAAIAAPARAQPSVSVLCYHSFIDKKKDIYSFSIDELNSHINRLKNERFNFVSINDIIMGRVSGTRNVLITVDDGNRSVIEAHRRVFRPNGIRPLLAIYPNIIVSKRRYALTWEELRELADSGCDIAAHGYCHRKISKKLRDENPGDFNTEIYFSKKIIEEKLGRRVNVFVYPYGMRDDATIAALKDAGYRYAFTIDRGPIDLPLSYYSERLLELPRYMVTRERWNYCFAKLMQNAKRREGVMVAAGGARAPVAAVDGARDIRDGERGASEIRAKQSVGNNDRARKATSLPGAVAAEERGRQQADEGGNLVFARDAGAISIASPVQRVLSNVRRDVLEPERAESFPPREGPTSAGFIDSSPLGTVSDMPSLLADRVDTLKGRVDAGWSSCYPKMKNQYRRINSRSLETYHDIFGIVKGKIKRIKRRIRAFVMSNL